MSYLQGESLTVCVAFSETVSPTHQTVTVAANDIQIEDVAGELIDPAEVALVVRDGADAVTRSVYGVIMPPQAYTISKDATGVYYADIPFDVAGRWVYRWEGDEGTAQAKISHEVEVNVTPQRVVVGP